MQHLSRLQTTEWLPDMPPLNQYLVKVGKYQDKECFALLFDYFAPRIKSWLMGRGCSPDMAEEVSQQAMLKIWRRADLYDPEKAAASTWVFRVARNLHIDLIRKEKVFDTDEVDLTAIPATDDDPETSTARSQEIQIMQDALEQLPPEQAIVVRMSFFNGDAHGEIATKLNLPLGTVKSRIRLAFLKLQEYTGTML